MFVSRIPYRMYLLRFPTYARSQALKADCTGRYCLYRMSYKNQQELKTRLSIALYRLHHKVWRS